MTYTGSPTAFYFLPSRIGTLVSFSTGTVQVLVLEHRELLPFVLHFCIMRGPHQGTGLSKIGGVMCNDSNGLCLLSEGHTHGDPGVCTNLVRLASQLSPFDPGNVPLITLESQFSVVLIKDYDGNTVSIHVPSDEFGSDSKSSDSLQA